LTPPDPDRPAAGRAAPRILLALASALACVLLLEVSARVFERAVPPARGSQERDPPEPAAVPAPEPGAFRVFLYGGSTVAGVPIPEYSFAAQLDHWLGQLAAGRVVRVVNFGRSAVPSRYVRAELERTLPARPDLAIVMTAHNEFLGWKPESRSARLRRELRRRLDVLAIARVLRRLTARDRDLLPRWLAPRDPESQRTRDTQAAYRENLRAIIAQAAAARVPLILATGPANLADWPPAHRFLRSADYDAQVLAAERLVADGPAPEAEARVRELAQRWPGDAMLVWLTGRLAARRGDLDAARAAFDAARDADAIPWRALGAINDSVRELAHAEGVPLADLDAAFRRHAAGGLVGFELVADNCHPTPLGNALIARELLVVIAREGLLPLRIAELPPLAEQAAGALLDARETRPDAPLDYLLANARYAMKWPFYHFDISTAYLDEAERLAPDDWRVWANRGTVSVLAGRIDAGRAQLERAAALYGAPLVADDRAQTPQLREALGVLAGRIARFAPAEPEPVGAAP
jgi:lysophospholipase L1-like esterase